MVGKNQSHQNLFSISFNPAADVNLSLIVPIGVSGYVDKNFLYGPCHGLGLIEVEAPWMETSSTYPLQKNMTFQIDTFVMGSDFGLRWEKPIAITETGVDMLSEQIGKIHELEF